MHMCRNAQEAFVSAMRSLMPYLVWLWQVLTEKGVDETKILFLSLIAAPEVNRTGCWVPA